MGLSVLATYLINRVAKRYYTAPLIINAVAIIILMGMRSRKQFTAEHVLTNYTTYMPIVAASVTIKVLFLIRHGRYTIAKSLGIPINKLLMAKRGEKMIVDQLQGLQEYSDRVPHIGTRYSMA